VGNRRPRNWPVRELRVKRAGTLLPVHGLVSYHRVTEANPAYSSDHAWRAIWPIASEGGRSLLSATPTNEMAFRTMHEARTGQHDRSSRGVAVHPREFLLQDLQLIVRYDVLAMPWRSERAHSTWFRFEVFCEWTDHALTNRCVKAKSQPTRSAFHRPQPAGRGQRPPAANASPLLNAGYTLGESFHRCETAVCAQSVKPAAPFVFTFFQN